MYEVKKIDDVGVFMVTSVFSIFAYVWMYLCLVIITPGYVTRAEAWITLAFFFLLLAMAFGADKYRQR
jgi:solute carrier family 8 (sodium/calcium exchanger)